MTRVGYRSLSIPELTIRTDTLHLDALLHTDPVTVFSSGNDRHHLPSAVPSTAPGVLVLVRRSSDSLSAMIAGGHNWEVPVMEKDFESVDVLIRGSFGAVRHGGSAVAGVLRVVTKMAIAFPFPEMTQRRPH